METVEGSNVAAMPSAPCRGEARTVTGLGPAGPAGLEDAESPGRRTDPRQVSAEVAAENARWLRELRTQGAVGDDACAGLHAILLRAATGEVWRRRRYLGGRDLEDLAYQAAADSLLCILGRLSDFRGESRFTTWAHRFVVYEVSAKLRKLTRHGPTVGMEAEDWERIPGLRAEGPDDEVQCRDLAQAVRRIIADELTERQRTVFVAVAIEGRSVAEVAADLGSNRNAVHQTMFQARRNLRTRLSAGGYLCDTTAAKDR
ncbi:MAG: RNA polymerase sigma factor [Marmoricola sp.]